MEKAIKMLHYRTMLALLVTAALAGGALSIRAEGAEAKSDAYAALIETTKITSKTVNAAGCLVTGDASFEGYKERLSAFREEWLNRDQSLDFYRQRQKQVFAYIVVKRFAELITEGIYSISKDAPPTECSFAIVVSYHDKFGQPKTLPAVTWRFNQQQAARVNWEHFDPRDFHTIALDYRISPEIATWMADEPGMNDAPASSATAISPGAQCNRQMPRANAIFIRSTTFCQKNFMDSPAGYKALAGAKQCATADGIDDNQIKGWMLELDGVVRIRGKAQACKWVEFIAQQVLSSVSK